MTYSDLIKNPVDGIFLVLGTHTRVIVEGARVIHSPRGMTIDDDALIDEE